MSSSRCFLVLLSSKEKKRSPSPAISAFPFLFCCISGIFYLTAAHALAFTTRLPVVAARSFISNVCATFRLQDGFSGKKKSPKNEELNFMRELLFSSTFWRGGARRETRGRRGVSAYFCVRNFAVTMACKRSSFAEVQWCVK